MDALVESGGLSKTLTATRSLALPLCSGETRSWFRYLRIVGLKLGSNLYSADG